MEKIKEIVEKNRFEELEKIKNILEAQNTLFWKVPTRFNGGEWLEKYLLEHQEKAVSIITCRGDYSIVDVLEESTKDHILIIKLKSEWRSSLNGLRTLDYLLRRVNFDFQGTVYPSHPNLKIVIITDEWRFVSRIEDMHPGMPCIISSHEYTREDIDVTSRRMNFFGNVSAMLEGEEE